MPLPGSCVNVADVNKDLVKEPLKDHHQSGSTLAAFASNGSIPIIASDEASIQISMSSLASTDMPVSEQLSANSSDTCLTDRPGNSMGQYRDDFQKRVEVNAVQQQQPSNEEIKSPYDDDGPLKSQSNSNLSSYMPSTGDTADNYRKL